MPIVAIVGRPNVGKSSLLNVLAGRRISIVDATPGVTRDRVSVCCELSESGGWVELVDTGGMGIEDTDKLTDHVESQITYGITAADLVLFVVDAREGVTPLDRHVADRLRKEEKKVVLLANKIDQAGVVTEVGEMFALGFGEPMQVSAAHNQNIDLLRETILETLGDAVWQEPEETVMKLALVGKRNAGKSTFLNALAGSQRVIVSETPGTTRDSVDVDVVLDGRTFTLIDTAGVRKKKSLDGDIEFYSFTRSMSSISRADVVALLIDASVKVSQVDKKLAMAVAEQHKPVLFVVNKWDLADQFADPEDYAEYLEKVFPMLAFAPISLTTAIDGGNVRETIQLAEQLFAQSHHRIGTGKLNSIIKEILELRGPSHKRGTKPPKIYYASQVASNPPTIVLFVNDPRSFDQTYQRFLINQFRQRTPFAEVPIRLIIRQRS
ncbi:MAG: ribosome biogenesis GTPase Der [Phycisphaerae bacterium]